MAKPRKPSTTRRKSTTSPGTSARTGEVPPKTADIEDAVVLGDIAPAPDDPVETTAEPGPQVAEETDAPDEPEESQASPGPDAAASVYPPDPGETGPDPLPMPEPVAAPGAVPGRAKGGGRVVLLLLGGCLAAAIGAGALYLGQRAGIVDLWQTAELRAAILDQNGRIQALEAALTSARGDIGDLQTAEPDLTSVTGAIDGLTATTQSQIDALRTAISATDARLSGIETRPIPKAELPAEVSAAYDAKLADIDAAVTDRFAAMQTAEDARIAAIETRLKEQLSAVGAAQAAADAARETADSAARDAERRAALANIRAALDGGSDFGAALKALLAITGGKPPAALAAVADGGAPTLAVLQASFPDAARAALVAATQAAAADGSVGRWTAFLRTQMGVRSLAPRSGDDADAVLSRAEAALGRGDLDAVAAELSTLPNAGQAAFTGWLEQLTLRRDALAALRDLSGTAAGN